MDELKKEVKVYSVNEVSEILQVTPRSVYRWIREQKMKASKIGRNWRVTHQDLKAFIEKGTRGN